MNSKKKFFEYINLVEVIQDLKEEKNKGLTFIESDENEQFISYNELYQRSLVILSHLQSKGMKPGDELLFQVECNCDFIMIFWACILGSIIPVPVTTTANDRFKLKLLNIWNALNNPYLITSKKHLEKLVHLTKEDSSQKIIEVIKKKVFFVHEMEKSCDKGKIHYPKETDVAFIQFSSGSTNQSKGVVLTHKNLMSNIKSIIIGIVPPEKGDLMFSWMPLTHDMGLIGFHLTPTLANWSHFIMPTSLFIRHPSLWIKKVTQHKITMTSSPNFGYKHLLRFYNKDKVKGIDLSTLRLIVNGAEPISEELCQTFLEKMKPLGLKKGTMFPVYGLAEASLAVTFSVPEQGITSVNIDRESIRLNGKVKEVEKPLGVSFVEVGTPINCCSLKITDDNRQQAGDRVIGHIMIRGDNVTSGYYNNFEATKEAIIEDGWLDTGDLGFLRDGRLVITGRVKDTLFANGHTYFAHDIEYAVEDFPGFKINRSAVVGVFNHDLQTDEIICFILYRKNNKEEFLNLSTALKKWVVKRVGVGISQVIGVKQIPITTSGKTQRYKLKESYLAGEFKPV